MTVDQMVPDVNVMELSLDPNLYERYAELRRAGPLARGGPLPCWVITKHAEVAAALKDKRLGHEFPRNYVEALLGDGPSADFQENVLLNRDPPDHTRLRSLMSKAFSGLAVRKLRDHISDLVSALLSPALKRGHMDIVDDLAFPLPIQVISELLGIVDIDQRDLRPHVVNLVSQDREAADAATVWLRDYIGGVLAERQADPEGDLLERMLAAEDGEDALTHDEIVDNALLLFFAGFETTSNLIANGCAALLEHPEQRDLLWSNPSLAPSAVEEFLRYDTPVPMVNRLTLEPIEVGGRVIKEKRWVVLLLASANHDEDVFENPEDLDITRTPNRHVGFGGGIHHCLGAMLARLEGEVVFERLAAKIGTFEAAGPPVRRLSTIRSFSSVPVRVTRA